MEELIMNVKLQQGSVTKLEQAGLTHWVKKTWIVYTSMLKI